jgi:hypothetical protein
MNRTKKKRTDVMNRFFDWFKKRNYAPTEEKTLNDGFTRIDMHDIHLWPLDSLDMKHNDGSVVRIMAIEGGGLRLYLKNATVVPDSNCKRVCRAK